MLTWARLKTAFGYLLTLVLMVATVIAVQSQSYEEEPSAEGRLSMYNASHNTAIYPGDDGLYPNEIYPGDWPPLYPGDERWDGQYQDYYENDPEVRSLATDGQSIYVGGQQLSIAWWSNYSLARWQKDHWSYVPGGNQISGAVQAIAVQDNNFYVGGTITSVELLQVNNIAHWNGSLWDDMAGGVTNDADNGMVARILPKGSDVFVAGTFSRAGNNSVNNIARWDGELWHDLGGGVNGPVKALAANGSDVYVGGQFTSAGGQAASNIARWDGQSWHSLGSGVDGNVRSIAIQGSNIYVGGSFTNAGGQTVNAIARWDGSQWHPLGNGLKNTVNAVAVGPEGVYAGGSFALVLGQYSAYNIAFWDGVSWTNLGSGTGGDGNWSYGYINDILVQDDKVFAGGRFFQIGNNYSNSFGIWHKLPEASVYQLDDTPIAPGSTIYLYGEFFQPNQAVQLSIDGVTVSRSLFSDEDGKVYVRLMTSGENEDGTYAFTLTSGSASVDGSFVLQKGAPFYSTVWSGKTIIYPDHPVHLPVIRK